MSQSLFQRIAENPFYVLGLRTDCSRTDVEREGSKLLSMLALGLKEAKAYRTPLGEHPRTDESVRAAMAELRDPSKRLVHEVLAALGADVTVPPPPAQPAQQAEGWARAPLVFGYGPNRER